MSPCPGNRCSFCLLQIKHTLYAVEEATCQLQVHGRKKPESAASAARQAAEERSRQQALQKALQAVMRLEAALSSSSATMVRHRL